jgi:general secretion pathway protein G
MRINRRRRTQAGITLIEMLVVVTIIALFAGIVGVNMFKQGDKAKRVAARTQIENFMAGVQTYHLATGTYPSTAAGLKALRVKQEDVPNWDGPYLEKDIPMDPWGRPYLYKYPGEHGDSPDIVSVGADGQLGGEGNDADVESWNNK